ncbi:hypothetical protein [Natrinema sp. DC36]|uniref:hypothetical protein n=1 Tax=Natrinema sp. DC36 TaxID=2878680 RepID=UPI001CF03176|nr:hypothetical protein [Natrinema sp. DC36]
MAAALEEWTYSTSPSDRDAISQRLSTTFPTADVRRSGASTAADVRVDGVRVIVAHRLDSAFRRDFHVLADQFDDVVVYSTTCHTSTPNGWREFKHRHRGNHAGARVRFVHRREATADDGGSTVRALAALALPIVGIVGLLAASLGLFDTGGSAVAGLEGHARAIGLIAAVVVGVTVACLLTRRRIYVSLLRRIPHT